GKTTYFDAYTYYPPEIVVADLNRDGIPDVASPVSGDSLIVELGSADGTLLRPEPVSTPGGATFSASADIDGDGFADIAYGDQRGAGIPFGAGTGRALLLIALPTRIASAGATADSVVVVAVAA